MNTRLRILCEQDYIARRYDESSKRRIQFASYYLLPKGIAVLKERPKDFRYQVLRNIRKDVNASDRFAEHCLNVFTLYAAFKELYGDDFTFYTKSHISNVDYFPKPLPDAYVKFKKRETGEKLRHYMIECFDGTMPEFVMKQRIEALVNHADSGEWTAKTTYPNTLLVCGTDSLQKKAQKWADKALDQGWADKLVITATTKNTLAETLALLA